MDIDNEKNDQTNTAIDRRRMLKAGAAVGAAAWAAPTIIGSQAAGASVIGGGFGSAPPCEDAQWEVFDFGGVGSGSGPIPISGVTRIDVADCCLKGDRFEVFIDGVSQGQTTAVPEADGTPSGYAPCTAFEDPTYSSGTFIVSSGPHTLEIIVTVSPFGSGGAWYRLL